MLRCDGIGRGRLVAAALRAPWARRPRPMPCGVEEGNGQMMMHELRRRREIDPADFPSADRIAKALILAAIDLGELSILAKHPDNALRGKVKFRARWVAFSALCALHLRARPQVIGRLIGCGTDPIGTALSVRGRAWWSDARVQALFEALVIDAPLQPLFTPGSAYGVMIAVRERIADRAR